MPIVMYGNQRKENRVKLFWLICLGFVIAGGVIVTLGKIKSLGDPTKYLS